MTSNQTDLHCDVLLRSCSLERAGNSPAWALHQTEFQLRFECILVVFIEMVLIAQRDSTCVCTVPQLHSPVMLGGGSLGGAAQSIVAHNCQWTISGTARHASASQTRTRGCGRHTRPNLRPAACGAGWSPPRRRGLHLPPSEEAFGHWQTCQ